MNQNSKMSRKEAIEFLKKTSPKLQKKAAEAPRMFKEGSAIHSLSQKTAAANYRPMEFESLQGALNNKKMSRSLVNMGNGVYMFDAGPWNSEMFIAQDKNNNWHWSMDPTKYGWQPATAWRNVTGTFGYNDFNRKILSKLQNPFKATQLPLRKYYQRYGRDPEAMKSLYRDFEQTFRENKEQEFKENRGVGTTALDWIKDVIGLDTSYRSKAANMPIDRKELEEGASNTAASMMGMTPERLKQLNFRYKMRPIAPEEDQPKRGVVPLADAYYRDRYGQVKQMHPGLMVGPNIKQQIFESDQPSQDWLKAQYEKTSADNSKILKDMLQKLGAINSGLSEEEQKKLQSTPWRPIIEEEDGAYNPNPLTKIDESLENFLPDWSNVANPNVRYLKGFLKPLVKSIVLPATGLARAVQWPIHTIVDNPDRAAAATNRPDPSGLTAVKDPAKRKIAAAAMSQAGNDQEAFARKEIPMGSVAGTPVAQPTGPQAPPVKQDAPGDKNQQWHDEMMKDEEFSSMDTAARTSRYGPITKDQWTAYQAAKKANMTDNKESVFNYLPVGLRAAYTKAGQAELNGKPLVGSWSTRTGGTGVSPSANYKSWVLMVANKRANVPGAPEPGYYRPTINYTQLTPDTSKHIEESYTKNSDMKATHSNPDVQQAMTPNTFWAQNAKNRGVAKAASEEKEAFLGFGGKKSVVPVAQGNNQPPFDSVRAARLARSFIPEREKQNELIALLQKRHNGPISAEEANQIAGYQDQAKAARVTKPSDVQMKRDIKNRQNNPELRPDYVPIPGSKAPAVRAAPETQAMTIIAVSRDGTIARAKTADGQLLSIPTNRLGEEAQATVKAFQQKQYTPANNPNLTGAARVTAMNQAYAKRSATNPNGSSNAARNYDPVVSQASARANLDAMKASATKGMQEDIAKNPYLNGTSPSSNSVPVTSSNFPGPSYGAASAIRTPPISRGNSTSVPSTNVNPSNFPGPSYGAASAIRTPPITQYPKSPAEITWLNNQKNKAKATITKPILNTPNPPTIKNPYGPTIRPPEERMGYPI